MDCRQIRDGSGVIAFLGIWLYTLDFIAFTLVSYFIGGVHFYGRAGGGEYSLAFGANGPFTPVSEWVYYYSAYHWWTIKGLACIWAPATLLYILTRNVCPDCDQPDEPQDDLRL